MDKVQIKLNNIERAAKKKAALTALESLRLDLPESFDADKELADAMDEKYSITD